MADQEQRRKQVDDLIAQDPHIDDQKMRDFRMQLQQDLADWQRRGTIVFRTLCLAAIAYVLEMVFAFAFLNHMPKEIQDWYAWPFMIILWITFLVGISSVVLYVGRYMPTIRRMRFDVQTAMIAELQQQVVALREEVRRRDQA